jgi:polar amino acid transport system ATP-binding protein
MDKSVLIETTELSKYYADGKVVALDKVSFRVNQGELFAIKGPSGSGKSTLLHLIGGLDQPTSGEMHFLGRPLYPFLKQSGFRIRNVGFVFQVFYLWPTLNVLQNVLLPLVELKMGQKERVKRADELIATVGLSHKRLSAIPKLSVGERQRVAIARAIAIKPRFLLFDEPTSALDPEITSEVLDIIRELQDEGRDLLLITHHMGFARMAADHCLFVAGGKIRESGSVDRLFNQPESVQLQQFLGRITRYD